MIALKNKRKIMREKGGKKMKEVKDRKKEKTPSACLTDYALVE